MRSLTDSDCLRWLLEAIEEKEAAATAAAAAGEAGRARFQAACVDLSLLFCLRNEGGDRKEALRWWNQGV